MNKAIPEGFHSLTAGLIFKDTLKAIEFYKSAFGAVERYVMPMPGGKGVMHAEIMIGDSILMMNDEFEQQQCKSAESMGGSPVSFYLYVEEVDAVFRMALAAGATEQMPVQEMFWGDRAGSLRDPFGYNWMIASHTRDLSPQEIADGAKAAFSKSPGA
jgi:PhnB protein